MLSFNERGKDILLNTELPDDLQKQDVSATEVFDLLFFSRWPAFIESVNAQTRVEMLQQINSENIFNNLIYQSLSHISVFHRS